MKNIKCLVLLLLVAVSLSACGPSAEEKAELQAETAQYNEWAAQAEEIESLLYESITFSEEVFGEAKISVYNTAGEITAFVEVTSDNASRSNFGALVSTIGDRFSELPEEYDEYTFGDITFSYFYTYRNGDKSQTPAMTYKLHADGSSYFLEPNSDIPARYDITPDDVYNYLSNG